MSQLLGYIDMCFPVVPVLGLIILVLLPSNITKVNQKIQQYIVTHPPSLYVDTFQSYLHIPWSLSLHFIRVYETLIKYQYLLKQRIHHFQHSLHNYQLQLAIHQKNDRDQTPETQDCNTKVSSVTTHHTQKPQCTFENAPVRVSAISGERVITNTKQKLQNQSKQKITLDRTKSAEWTVVKENKKKRHSPKTPPIKEKSQPSTPDQSSTKKSKSKSRVQDTKGCVSSPTSNKCKSDSNTPASHHLPWSAIVKNQEHESLSVDPEEVPHLSDNDSTTGSIESPCLSHKELFQHPSPVVGAEMMEKANRYYSPFFSTAFDFGVLPSSQTYQKQHQPISNKRTVNSTIDNRLDEYLNSQQPFWNGSEEYTPNSMTQHQRLILNLLNQSEQVETTITPTSFTYFDDMMMSTSLYKTDESANKYPLLVNINKRDWNSISHYIH